MTGFSVTLCNLTHDCASFLPIFSSLLEITAGYMRKSQAGDISFFLLKWIEAHIHFVIQYFTLTVLQRICFLCYCHKTASGIFLSSGDNKIGTDSFRNPSSKRKRHLSDTVRNAFLNVFAASMRGTARVGYVGLCTAK